MKVATLLATLLGAAAAAASAIPELAAGPQLTPRKMRGGERVARRAAARRGNTMQPAVYGGNISEVSYSSNWAGAVLVGSGYKSVTGTITVPTPKEPSGGSSRTEYAASAWVGIDGDTCESAILQTGVDFYVEGSSVSFDAWYEWYPNYAYNFNGISISAGDSVTMTVTATSKSAGTAVIVNHSTGQTVTENFSGERNQLCETNAEWIVEDFEEGSGMVPFANFGTVTFTGASASTSSGSVGLSGAQILDIEQNGKVLTSCSASGSSVSCTYE